jgi:hypothetical protein
MSGASSFVSVPYCFNYDCVRMCFHIWLEARCWWLEPVILALWEADTRKIIV